MRETSEMAEITTGITTTRQTTVTRGMGCLEVVTDNDSFNEMIWYLQPGIQQYKLVLNVGIGDRQSEKRKGTRVPTPKSIKWLLSSLRQPASMWLGLQPFRTILPCVMAEEQKTLNF